MIQNWSEERQSKCLNISKEEFAAGKSEKILLALALASEIHKDDFRKSGEPYIQHCIVVAEILCQWGADEEEIIAGLLHDAVEDHPETISLEKIGKEFGERTAHLVDGVTKIKSVSEKEGDFQALLKVTRETLYEPGIAKIKLADRLHNMLTRGPFSPERSKIKGNETLAVYVPLAESLGLWQVKNALANISFSFVDPKKYLKVKEKIDADPRLDEKFIKTTEENIRKILIEAKIPVNVSHAIGSYWSLSEKEKKSGMRSDSRPKDFTDITDVVSFRVTIDDEINTGECYRALGVVRGNYYKQLQLSRSDDYLAIPAINGYSALHDTYKFEEGNIEIAFTTRKREQYNNWGVAGLSRSELLSNPERYKRKLIFTPKEELAVMELSARGIDVAYRLNPVLGLRAVAIKINGEKKLLDCVVPNSSMVEIITDQHQMKPKLEWLEYCNSETASQIDSQIKMAEHNEEVLKGEKILVDSLLKDRGVLEIRDLEEDVVDKLLMDLGCWNGIDDLYYKIAYGMDLSLVSQKLDELKVKKGKYTSIQIKGPNKVGVSEQVAGIIARNGGDSRNNVEWVDKDEMFTIRVLVVVGEIGKKKIEEELRKKFQDCVVV